MQDDVRSLLEDAAKAANMDVSFEAYDDFGVYDTKRQCYWHPLTNDGDAFRLAIRLNLFEPELFADWGWCISSSFNEVCAHYRRIIVEEAARIGRGECSIPPPRRSILCEDMRGCPGWMRGQR